MKRECRKRFNSNLNEIQVDGSEQDLVPVVVKNGEILVASRSLHERLQVSTPHRIWIARRIREYGFVWGVDYHETNRTNLYGLKEFNEEASGLQMFRKNAKNYLLSIDMAKELAMVENNEAGKMIRRYFIEVEKRSRVGFALPQLQEARTLFWGHPCYKYMTLLKACGLSVESGSVYNRIHRYPNEFIKNQWGIWLVKEEYGRTIAANAVTRRLNLEAQGRKLEYKQQQALES
jgi:phage anti-repressor protein